MRVFHALSQVVTAHATKCLSGGLASHHVVFEQLLIPWVHTAQRTPCLDCKEQSWCTYVSVQSVRLLLSSGFNRKSVSPTDFSKNILNTKFYQNPPSGSRVVPWGWTDSEANSRLLPACSVCQLSARLNVMQVSVQHFRDVGLAVSSVVNRALQCLFGPGDKGVFGETLYRLCATWNAVDPFGSCFRVFWSITSNGMIFVASKLAVR